MSSSDESFVSFSDVRSVYSDTSVYSGVTSVEAVTQPALRGVPPYPRQSRTEMKYSLYQQKLEAKERYDRMSERWDQKTSRILDLQAKLLNPELTDEDYAKFKSELEALDGKSSFFGTAALKKPHASKKRPEPTRLFKTTDFVASVPRVSDYVTLPDFTPPRSRGKEPDKGADFVGYALKPGRDYETDDESDYGESDYADWTASEYSSNLYAEGLYDNAADDTPEPERPVFELGPEDIYEN